MASIASRNTAIESIVPSTVALAAILLTNTAPVSSSVAYRKEVCGITQTGLGAVNRIDRSIDTTLLVVSFYSLCIRGISIQIRRIHNENSIQTTS